MWGDLVFVGAHASYEQRCGGKGGEKKNQMVLQCPMVSPRKCPSCSHLYLPFPAQKAGALTCSQGSAEVCPARSWAPWWEADGQYFEDREAQDEEGNAWARADRQPPPAQAHGQCCSWLKNLESSLAAIAWRVTPSPNTRPLGCLAHHASSSYWLNSTASWYFLPRYWATTWLTTLLKLQWCQFLQNHGPFTINRLTSNISHCKT